jgi:hypothetical protein
MLFAAAVQHAEERDVLLMHHPEYPSVATDYDAARSDERCHEEGGFGRVTVAVLQDGAGSQFCVQTEHSWKEIDLVECKLSVIASNQILLVREIAAALVVKWLESGG